MKKIFYFFALTVSIMLSACGGDDDEPKLKFDDISLAYGNTYSIPNGDNTEWTSSNELIATVSGATVKAQRVGETVISSDKGVFKVTVTPTSFVFTEPLLRWGESKGAVKSFMQDISSVSLYEDSSTKLQYRGSGLAMLYSYTFENGGVSSSGVALNGDYVNSDAMSKFMIERYIPVSVDESTYSFFFISPDEKTTAMMRLTTSGRTIIYMVVYVPAVPSRSTIEINDAFNGIETISSPEVKKTFDLIKATL